MQTAASAVQHLSLVLIMKTVSCTTGVIDELDHGTAGRTSQAMHPENAQCASAFFYSSEGYLARAQIQSTTSGSFMKETTRNTQGKVLSTSCSCL